MTTTQNPQIGCTSRDSTLHPKVLIVVPAFNEAGSISSVVSQILDSLSCVHVLVVDDGSSDNTAGCVPSHSRVTTISLPFNLGIGGAVQTGYRFAAENNFDIAIQVDGDGQHPPSEIIKLINHMVASNCDMAIGSRFLPGSGEYDVPQSRRTAICVLNSLIRVLTFGKVITDCTSGFRAVGRSAIHALAHWYPEDYPEPEVIVAMHRAGFTIEEIPINMQQREHGKSSISFKAGVFYVLKVGSSLMLTTIRNPWPSIRSKK